MISHSAAGAAACDASVTQNPTLPTSHLQVNAMKAVGVRPPMLHPVGVPWFRHLQ
jgi:hypothetical protein